LIVSGRQRFTFFPEEQLKDAMPPAAGRKAASRGNKRSGYEERVKKTGLIRAGFA